MICHECGLDIDCDCECEELSSYHKELEENPER